MASDYDANRRGINPDQPRSESTEYEQARRELPSNQPYSVIGAMINPQQASIMDAIRQNIIQRMLESGGRGALTDRYGQPDNKYGK